MASKCAVAWIKTTVSEIIQFLLKKNKNHVFFGGSVVDVNRITRRPSEIGAVENVFTPLYAAHNCDIE